MQSNWFSGIIRRATALNAALLFLVAVIAPTLTSVLSVQRVSALTDNVVINEVFPSPSSPDVEWVELYNPTSSPIDIAGWTIKDAASYQKILSGVVQTGSYIIVEVDQFNDAGDTITLSDSAAYSDAITYPAIANTKSYARVTDGNEAWEVRDAAQVTKNASNSTIIDPEPVGAELGAEEFVAHSSTAYKGISVGFNAKNFGTVTAVTVQIERSDGTVVTKNGNQGLFDLISNKADKQQLTAPIVIKEGTYKEADDLLHWDPAPAQWNLTTVPVKVTIKVTDENGTKTVASTDFKQGGSWPFYYSLIPKMSFTQEVNSNTTTSQTQTGWMFNRDTSTSTPFVFSDAQASIGDGSLYVPPIGPNASDKFVAEHFAFVPLLALGSVTYDFKVAETGQGSDAEHFYMNVYANFGSSSPTKFYDCRYDVVPQTGSTTDFTTVTFDPTKVYPVTTSASSPHECPTVPADMTDLEIKSIVRAVAINVGDSSANDAGVSGYIDNVAVDYKLIEIVYDFDPKAVTTPPSDDEEGEDGEDDETEDNGGGNAGNGGGAPESANSEVTATVVSTVSQFDRLANSQDEDTDRPTDAAETEVDQAVLAETNQNGQTETDQQIQDAAPVDSQNSNSWWWVLAALAVLFLVYKLLKGKKSNKEEV